MMENILEKTVKNMKYELHKIFEAENYEVLLDGIQLAECMKSEVSYVAEDIKASPALDINGVPQLDLTVSDSLCCSYCRTTFKDQVEQRNHYKLDWHRHNLKRNLRGMKFLNEEEFSKLADDVSSISGSESDSSDEDSLLTDETDQCAVTTSIQKQLIRHPKVFFVNKENIIVSLYRCILHGKEEVPSSSQQLFSLAQSCPLRSKWAILMIGGGHFAAAVFEGNNAILHKTFHSYTVRAKQGGSQSSRDSRSGSSHPKSAGASLRRYNEASFQQHIQDILETWSTELEKCHILFIRAVSHNRRLIFTGKNSTIKKNDPRIRTIPFPTRRATFSEVKRVHGMLSSIESYGSAETFLSSFPVSPRRPQLDTATGEVKECNTPVKTSSSTPPSLPEKQTQKKKIDRGKPRLSPCRPLPDHVEMLAAVSTTDEDLSGEDLAELLEVMDMEDTLQEFGDDVPQQVKQDMRSRKRRSKKKPAKQTSKSDEPILPKIDLSPEAADWIKRVMSVRHDTSLMASVLSERSELGISEDEAAKALSQPVDTRGNTLLHVAASQGMPDRVRLLLEAGLNPCLRNKDKKPPFKVSKDWETKKAFRRFQADFSTKYDYSEAEIPGPLTVEDALAEETEHAERKKAQRKARKERMADKKRIEAEHRKVEDEKRKKEQQEQEERNRFLNLDDRQKRALAAERRLLASGGNVMVRCFLCGTDMTGQVPFSYETFNFCSMTCLKAHRFNKPKTVL